MIEHTMATVPIILIDDPRWLQVLLMVIVVCLFQCSLDLDQIRFHSGAELFNTGVERTLNENVNIPLKLLVFAFVEIKVKDNT